MAGTPVDKEPVLCKFCHSKKVQQTTSWFRQGVPSQKYPDKMFLGIIAGFKCLSCGEEFAVIDSLTGNVKEWRKYPPLEKEQ